MLQSGTKLQPQGQKPWNFRAELTGKGEALALFKSSQAGTPAPGVVESNLASAEVQPVAGRAI